MPQAPFFGDHAQGPEGGRAYWLTTADGVRLRMGLWPKGDKGTVLMLPGRTEYIEKYSRPAAEFGARGYSVAVIDWRGQGLSDRPKPDPMQGHVDNFAQYQQDLATMQAKLTALGISGPFYMACHSMGGCIGLRALMDGVAVKAVAFSAPMWGLKWALPARIISKLACVLGLGQRYVPGYSAATYLAATPFKGNVLTKDAESYAWLQSQARNHPELTLGGPSLRWLDAALRECRTLGRLPSPDLPAICMVGDAEKVVAATAIHARMAHWPKGRLKAIAQAEHELMAEFPQSRRRFYDAATALFAANP
ncbi:alpha/beta hydrolase (plasmid) [Pseudorhodobacter turbinis]|uniref:Alpha/beta hydrolase n=1 Tax=Pseudorhodobacter turbinis TaxID=2500533 RepID=A0A4P8ELH1_9RHOB|nr:alpha/beta hydrolase [Pseudorhodobacter turbinis]QCO57655.1 alpha/beta hydrolase [Pseudorhodobacter turbinis]